MPKKYEVIVIGTGPGGEGAAMKAAKGGKHVAVIEERPSVGGNCTHRTTIPSKSLRQTVQKLIDCGRQGVSYSDLLRDAQGVIDRQVSMRSSFYYRNRVDMAQGRASFIDDHTIEVSNNAGAREVYQADYFIIATGSRPYRPVEIDFSHPRVLDSDTVLEISDTPRTLTVYGAGVVGCEYASIFRNLGIKVNLVNTRNQLLSYLDDEIIDALSYHFREQGVLIRHNEEHERVEADDQGVTLFLKSKKQIRSDYLLWAQGRTGNSDRMSLEEIGVEINGRGFIKINECYQSTREHIYAVGDVVGHPSLASAAYDQGRFAATHIVRGVCETGLLKNIPTGIYTLPEISSIGQTERELTADKVPYEVGRSLFKHLARAQISGKTVGMLKMLFHRETLEILGIHCFGDQAAEIIHIGQAVMTQEGKGNSLRYFVNTTFNYPTMAEAYRVAALNGLNRVQ